MFMPGLAKVGFLVLGHYSDSSVWTNDSSHRVRNGEVLPSLFLKQLNESPRVGKSRPKFFLVLGFSQPRSVCLCYHKS